MKLNKNIIMMMLLCICSVNSVYSTTIKEKGRTVEQIRRREKLEDLKGLVRNLNEVCPYTNGDARFDKFEVLTSGEVGIFITYVGEDIPLDAYSDEELQALDFTDSKEAMISVIRSNSWTPLRTCEPIFILYYRDPNGRNLFQIKIDPSEYQINEDTGDQAKRQKLQEVVNTLNKSCPMVTNATVYEKVELLDTDEVEIFITYKNNTPLSKYSDKQLRALDEAFKKMLLPQIQGDSWAVLRSYGATFVMSYHDKNKRQLFRIKLHPEDYNN